MTETIMLYIGVGIGSILFNVDRIYPWWEMDDIDSGYYFFLSELRIMAVYGIGIVFWPIGWWVGWRASIRGELDNT